MAWDEIVVIEVPGVDPDDAPGFVQWVDVPMASLWQAEVKRRASLEVITAAQGKPYADQAKLVSDLLESISNYYRSLNISWIADRPATDLWWDYWGGYEPKDPGVLCIEPTPGPNALWSGLSRWPQVGFSAAGIVLSENEQAQLRKPGAIGTQPVFNAQRMRALWTTVKPNGAALWDAGVDCVVPAYLDYKSMPRTRLSADPSVGYDSQKFDGVYTGAAIGGGQVPNDSWRTSWSLDGWRWDDAPFNRLRILPPARLALEHLRAWADLIANRNPLNVVKEARINVILINLERAKFYDPDGAGDFNAAVFDFLRAANRSRWNPTDAQTALKATAGTVCAGLTIANPAAGFACGIISTFADAILGFIPRAVGCDADQWGQLLPAAFEARLSLGDPPSFDVTPPPNPEGGIRWINTNTATAMLAEFKPVQLGDLENVDSRNKPGGLIGTQLGLDAAPTPSSTGKVIAGIAAAAGIALAMRKKGRRGRR